MRGTSSWPTRRRTASATYATSSGSRGRRRSMSAAVRNGGSMTGPTPALSSTSTPMALSGTTMSEKRMAASTPSRRTGCMVTSAASSGVWMMSNMPYCSRTIRYSGSDRPAWRMNQTGIRSAGRLRHANRNGESATKAEATGRCVSAALCRRALEATRPLAHLFHERLSALGVAQHVQLGGGPGDHPRVTAEDPPDLAPDELAELAARGRRHQAIEAAVHGEDGDLAGLADGGGHRRVVTRHEHGGDGQGVGEGPRVEPDVGRGGGNQARDPGEGEVGQVGGEGNQEVEGRAQVGNDGGEQVREETPSMLPRRGRHAVAVDDAEGAIGEVVGELHGDGAAHRVAEDEGGGGAQVVEEAGEPAGEAAHTQVVPRQGITAAEA